MASPYPQQPYATQHPNPSAASDPFASRRASFSSQLSGSSVGSGAGSTPYASYARGPAPAPSILSDHGDGRYGQFGPERGPSRAGSIGTSASANPYNLAGDPMAAQWTTKPEADDYLHDPSTEKKKSFGSGLSRRGMMNIGCLVLLVLIIVGGSVAYPLARHFASKSSDSSNGSSGSSSALTNGDLPDISQWSLIDIATPKDAHNMPSYHDPSKSMQLVFSDEFETDGRSFYPGDDPYWEAVDLHYWQTNNLEWYDPSAITTRNGALEINLTKVADPTLNHDLNYKGGMMSSWNKFCFTGGILVSSVTLPGATNIFGLWPAVWAMGNLGRAGYGASLDGMWPYSYDACDVGTLPNQTNPDGSGPQAAFNTGGAAPNYDEELSFLPGQRLSACTCPGESHPGPKKSDGTLVGRAAPEIDVFEAQIGGPDGAHVGMVSQSAQWAPFDKGYLYFNSTDNLIIADPTISTQNSYIGGQFQEATSVVSVTNQDCYQLSKGCFATYGFEYKPGYAEGYISWINNDKLAWTMNGNTVGANSLTEISARQVMAEPMYIILNLGISQNFGFVDFDHLTFPATMRVDWVRVYQDPDNINIGCDPADFPTADYINTYIEAYTNANLTTWVDDFHQTIPKNKLAAGSC